MALTAQDFTKGIDFTGINPATGADHNVLIESAVPKADTDGDGKGLVITTNDSALNTPVVPDASGASKWKRYIWQRKPHATATSTTPILYVWNENAIVDPVYSQWVESNASLTSLIADVATANANANTALGLANDLTGLVNTAIDTANTAKTTADLAKLTADGLADNIDEAIDLANEAKVDAAAAMTKATEALAAAGTTPIAELSAGTAGQHIRTNDGATAAEWYSPGELYCKLAETAAKNVGAGNAVTGENVRKLISTIDAASFCTLDAVTYKFTLTPGAYYFDIYVPGEGTNEAHQAFLLKSSDSSVLIAGTSAKMGQSSDKTFSPSFIKGFLVLAVTTELQVSDYWTGNTTGGLGVAANVAPSGGEIYTVVEIFKQ